MACFLRQSTLAIVKIGPFVDSGDGNTVESGLSITQPDIRLAKNGGNWAQKSAAQTLTHEENGWYEVDLSTTDTDTLGILIVAVHESGALPVWREFSVVPANVWDSLFSTDFLQVDLTQWLGSTPNALVSARVDTNVGNMGAGVISAGAINDGAFTATKFATGAITATAIASDTITAAKIAADAITAAKIADGTIDAATFAAGAINAAATNADFLAEINAEVDTALADYDGPTFAEMDARTDAIEADTQDIQARLPAALVSGRVDASTGAVASGVINAAAMAADMNTYTARVWMARDGADTDKYVVAWYRNGQLVTSGITLPKINVFKSSDGTDLIAETAMTEIGSKQRFKYEEGTNKLVAGDTYFADVKATIDGSVRTDTQQVMRDSA